MSIPSNYTTLARVVSHIQNPNKTTGTLIEEIPSDIGRSVEGYKRGGILEGAEKLRKELMAAAVWLLGIPAFKWIGDKSSELFLKVPMAIEFSKESEGNNAIKDSVEFLVFGKNDKNLDASELVKKYGDKFKVTDRNIVDEAGNIIDKAKAKDIVDSIVTKIKWSKKLTSVVAVGLNCLAMGVILPKINQKITSNKLKEMRSGNNSRPKQFDTFDEFKSKTKKQHDEPKSLGMTFKGGAPKSMDDLVYRVENDNVFRLIITDIPMIIGRILTSRNKFEALEYLLMDGSGIYLYNYVSGDVQRGLRKLFPNPDINPMVAEEISQQDSKVINNAIKQVENGSKKVSEIFGDNKKLQDAIYSHGTFGKYGKINKFVKNSEIDSIDKSVVEFLKHLKTELNDDITPDKIKQLTTKINKINAGYLSAGLGVSILGLAVLVPKLTFWITKKITGRNEFTGIADYNQNKK